MSIDPIRGAGPQGGLKPAEQPDVGAVAQDFAAMFTSLLVKEMWNSASLDGEGPFSGMPGGDVYRGLLEGALSQSLAKSGMGTLTGRIEEMLRRRPEEETRS